MGGDPKNEKLFVKNVQLHRLRMSTEDLKLSLMLQWGKVFRTGSHRPLIRSVRSVLLSCH